VKSPFTQLYLHCVWATWDRLPLLTQQVEQAVYAGILDKCKELKCLPLAIGGTSDHIHLLVRLHTTVSVTELVKEVKGVSSHLITHKVLVGEFFKWQGCYGAFTLAKEGVRSTKAYIEHQMEHHANGSILPEWEEMEEDSRR